MASDSTYSILDILNGADMTNTREKESPFVKIEHKTLRQLRQEFNRHEHCDLYDVLAHTLSFYKLSSRINETQIEERIQTQEEKHMLFAYEHGLSKDEMETLKYVIEGLTYREISERLVTITPSGVSKRIERIVIKLKAKDRADAIRIAIDEGLF